MPIVPPSGRHPFSLVAAYSTMNEAPHRRKEMTTMNMLTTAVASGSGFVAALYRWPAGSLASPSDLPAAEQLAAATILALAMAGLVTLRRLEAQRPIETVHHDDLDEAA
jgi:hypothetical protein